MEMEPVEHPEPWFRDRWNATRPAPEPKLDPLCRGGNHAGCVGPPGTTCECRCHGSALLSKRQSEKR